MYHDEEEDYGGDDNDDGEAGDGDEVGDGDDDGAEDLAFHPETKFSSLAASGLVAALLIGASVMITMVICICICI